jgi:hypothetical protein
MNTIARNSGAQSPPDGTVTSGPLTTFTLFPYLPPNLRIKIWSLANHQSRIIMCEDYHERYCKDARPPKHPATLVVNFESREEAKKAFSLIFEPRLGHPVAFNYATDTLFLANEDVTWYFRGPKYQRYDVDHRALVGSLALSLGQHHHFDCNSGDFEFDAHCIHEMLQVIKYFPNIQDLFVIPDEEGRDMKAAEKCLEAVIHNMIRKKRRNCCIMHDVDCLCTIWKLPKIHFLTLPRMKKALGAEIFNLNQGPVSGPTSSHDS